MSETNEMTEKFNAIVAKVKEQQQLNQEEAEFLVSIIAGFDAQLSLAQDVMSVTLGTANELLAETAAAVLRKCGRTDQKIRRKIAALCDENFQTLLNVIRLYSHQAQQKLNNPEEDNNVNEDNSSTGA
jgi:hypothetical protein